MAPGRERVALSWSGGKDSTMALYELRRSDRFEVACLLTTIAKEYERVSHHGVRTELVEQQAKALRLPLLKIDLPGTRCTNEEYETVMSRAMLEYKEAGISRVAFGDIFLEDLRAYRESNLAKVGMKAVFPIWHRKTSELVNTFINLGFEGCLACIDSRKLNKSFCGRVIDENLIRELPNEVDPCGENGEFHSFVFGGPIFYQPVGIKLGEVVLRDDRYFIDLLPHDISPPSPRGT